MRKLWNLVVVVGIAAGTALAEQPVATHDIGVPAGQGAVSTPSVTQTPARQPLRLDQIIDACLKQRPGANASTGSSGGTGSLYR